MNQNDSASTGNVGPESATVDFGIIVARLGPSEIRWRFCDPLSPSLEVAHDLDQQLQEFLARSAEQLRGKRHIFDLQHLPALSSRQLGTMLTLANVLQPHGGLYLSHTSPQAKHLLSLTRMERFYKFEQD